MNILISAWVLEVLGVKIKIFEKITIFLESLNWISLVSFNAYFGVCSSIQVFFLCLSIYHIRHNPGFSTVQNIHKRDVSCKYPLEGFLRRFFIRWQSLKLIDAAVRNWT